MLFEIEIETIFLRNPFVGMAKKSKPSIMKEGVHFEEAKTLQSTTTNITSTATSRNQVRSWSKSYQTNTYFFTFWLQSLAISYCANIIFICYKLSSLLVNEEKHKV